MVFIQEASLFLLLVLISHTNIVNTARILFVPYWVSKSHVRSLLPLAQKLASEGHQISFYFEGFDRIELPDNITNYQVLLKGMANPMKERKEFEIDMHWNKSFRPLYMAFAWILGAQIHSHVVNHQSIDYWKVANQSWDLIVVDPLFSVSAKELTIQSKVPYIIFYTTQIEYPGAYDLGNSWNPVADPPFFMYDSESIDWNPENFWNRLESMIHNLEYLFVYSTIVQWTSHYNIHFSPGFSWNSWIRGSELCFSDYMDTVTNPIPLTPQFVTIGASCPHKSGSKLPESLEKFVMDSESKGTILVVFGTMIKWELAPKDRIDALAGALERLSEYRIIWKYNGTKLNVSKHIMAMDWVPQSQLLNHHKTKLFVSHGGLKSFKETICAEVPAVYMPMFAEQVGQTYQARRLGFGGYINKRNLTPNGIEQEIRRILSNPNCYENVKKVKSVWLDKIINSMDLATFHSNKIMRTGISGKFYKPKAKDWLYQSHNLDIFIIYSVVLYVLMQ